MFSNEIFQNERATDYDEEPLAVGSWPFVKPSMIIHTRATDSEYGLLIIIFCLLIRFFGINGVIISVAYKGYSGGKSISIVIYKKDIQGRRTPDLLAY